MPDSNVLTSLPTILERLHTTYPDARYELDWETPEQLLVATILAAQCTDERVNQVTATLFKKYPDAPAFAQANLSELEEDLKPTGFYRQKARTVQAVCQDLVDRFAGKVPPNMNDLVTLPGVARKTANVVLNNAFRQASGVIVDTHVHRVSRRIGLTDQNKPEKIEIDLMEAVPKGEWVFFGPAMVLLGRYTCTAHRPDCANCIMNDLCPKLEVDTDDDDEAAADTEEDSATMATKKKTPPKKAPAAKKAVATKNSAAKPKAAEPAVPSLRVRLPADWQTVLQDEFDKPYFKQLEKFVAQERSKGTIYPPETDLFSAFHVTPFEQVKVLLLGQDPYHGPGEAHGMCFSVRPGVKVPPSLVNICKELQDDLGCKAPPHGYLGSWAVQGVLLLNTVLTVRANEAASHKEHGWEQFTDAVIRALAGRKKPFVTLLWGSQAHKKEELIDTKRHRVLKAAHPSPLSAKKFFGSKPFSQANKALGELGQEPVNWQLPQDPAQSAATATKAALPAARPGFTAGLEEAPAPAKAPPKEEPTHLERILPEDWRAVLADDVKKTWFRNLDKFLNTECQNESVFPGDDQRLFAALRLTPLKSVRVVLLGQEPPCTDDVADGLAFSVREGVELHDAQKVLFRELRDDLGCRMPATGSLESWARQGVLLINNLWTVRAGRPTSHKDKGWEQFTDAVLKAVNARPEPVVFVLFGLAARKKAALIDEERHAILTGEHPAVAPEKVLGSRLFSTINETLETRGRSGIYWQLPYV